MDARYPERYLHDRRVSRLNDAEHRAYVLALVWSVANRTDGVISVGDLDTLPRGVTREALDGLTRAELVTEQIVAGDLVWLLTDYAETQTTRAELDSLDAARRAKREKTARERAAAAEASMSAVPDTTQDRARHGQADRGSRSGSSAVRSTTQDRTEPGQEAGTTEVIDIQTRERVTEWETVKPGSGYLPAAVGAESDVF
jgi:hypothetical protein